MQPQLTRDVFAKHATQLQDQQTSLLGIFSVIEANLETSIESLQTAADEETKEQIFTRKVEVTKTDVKASIEEIVSPLPEGSQTIPLDFQVPTVDDMLVVDDEIQLKFSTYRAEDFKAVADLYSNRSLQLNESATTVVLDLIIAVSEQLSR